MRTLSEPETAGTVHAPPDATGIARPPAYSLRAVAVAAAALAALAIGAMSIGALAIARVAIGRAQIRALRIRRLEIDEIVGPVGADAPPRGVMGTRRSRSR